MLTPSQLEAALMVAQDRLTREQIARKVGITIRALADWKNDVEFRSEVERHLNLWAEDIEKRGIADKRRRLFRLNDRWRRGQAFIEQRAKMFRELVSQPDPEPIVLEDGTPIPQESIPALMRMVPGGETGLVAWKFRMLHVGGNQYEKIVEFEFDTGVVSAMNAIEEQAAIETGQWKPKQEISLTRASGPVRDEDLAKLTDVELQQFIALTEKAQSGRVESRTELPPAEPDAESLPIDGPPPQRALPKAP